MRTVRFIADGEVFRVDDPADLDPVQRSVRASSLPRQLATSTDPIKCMIDADYYRTYDARIENAWRNPGEAKPGGAS